MRTIYYGNALADILQVSEYLFSEVDVCFLVAPKLDDTKETTFYSSLHKTKPIRVHILELSPDETLYNDDNFSTWLSAIALSITEKIEVPEEYNTEVMTHIITEIMEAFRFIRVEDPTDEDSIVKLLEKNNVPRSVYNVKSYSDIRKGNTNEK